MSHHEDDEAPGGEEIAALLRERYTIDPSFKILVTTRIKKRAIEIQIERPARGARVRDRFRIHVTDVKDAGWDTLVDAADALVGMLVESSWSHRELPVGPDLSFADGTFEVEVECSRPELEAKADDILTKN